MRLYRQSKEKKWEDSRAWIVPLSAPALWLLVYSALSWWHHLPFWPWCDAGTANQCFGFIIGSIFAVGVFVALLSDMTEIHYKRTWEKWRLGPAELEVAEWYVPVGLVGNARDSRVPARVVSDGLESYPRFIPVHALEIALQVRSLVPGAVFHVHELTLKVEKRVPEDTKPKPDEFGRTRFAQAVSQALPDPFLSVVLGSEEYFVAVWDERDFEVRA